MKKSFHLIFLLTCLQIPVALVQSFQKYNSVPVTINGNQLSMPWAGGMNSPMFQTTDLNGDGIKDLVLFEKQSGITYPGMHRLTTYINNGIPNQVNYSYAPQYQLAFPNTLHDWMLLKDYDCDGHEDLFTYNSSGGIQVFHNNIAVTGSLSFSESYPLLDATMLGGSVGPINPTSQNLPVLIDVNFDGDMDILNVEQTGGRIEYYENFAQENFGRCDTFVFFQLKQCWGHMQLGSFSNIGLLNSCSNITDPNQQEKIQLHSGSCMAGFDQNVDLDVDLINGDLLGENLLFLRNSYTSFSNDFIVYQDTAYPSYNIPVDYQTFPAPYLIDVDNDSDRDLIVSSCAEIQSENFNNIMLYENTSNDVSYNFNFVKRRFLADEMIDVGSGSNICMVDVDADGLADMLVGNYGKFTFGVPSTFYSSISYFHNTGNASCPQFDLVTYDYDSLQSLGLAGLYPTAGDIDGDGDLDLVCGSVDGNLYLFQNNGGAGNPLNLSLAANGINWQGIDIGAVSAPQLVDVNGDSLLDLIIGTAAGKIYYYQNTGSATNSSFALQSNFFGGIDMGTSTTSFFGYSTPVLFSENGQLKLLVGSINGCLALYDSISGNLNGTFNLVSDSAYNIIEHYRSTPSRADLNNDNNPEILVGCFAGGVSFYSQTLPCLTSLPESITNAKQFAVFPNPANKYITVKSLLLNNDSYSLMMFNNMGQAVLSTTVKTNQHTLDCSALPGGIYLIKINSNGNEFIYKIVIR